MGSVVISIDAELGWGFHDVPSPPIRRIEAARSGWQRLLSLLDEYEVPATWAVVGHLFLESCDGVHADHPTPEHWFGRERAAWRDRPDIRFAPELITDVATSKVGHEIGSHSFSHVVFDRPWVDGEVVRAELRAAREVVGKGFTPRSFVCPRNAVGFREELAAAGFDAYRGARHVPAGNLARSAGKLAAAVDPDRARLVQPTVDEYGLVNVPPSLYLYGFEGLARTVIEAAWADPVVEQARHGIERAASGDSIFHLWLHPNNLVSAPDFRRLDAVLSHVDRCRREDGLDVETMGEVADRVG